MKAAYRLSSSKKKSFVRVEQQHEKLVRPWVKEHLRSTKESKSVSKARGRYLSAKTVDLLRRTGRGHLYNILDEANALVYPKEIDLFKTWETESIKTTRANQM